MPEGMGLIIRTAGATGQSRKSNATSIFAAALGRLRDLTLSRSRRALSTKKASLIKRAIRDLYDTATSTKSVAGENAHRAANDFMRMLMPSHAKNVHST